MVVVSVVNLTPFLAVVVAGIVAAVVAGSIRETHGHAAWGELFGRWPSSPHPAPATPRPTRIAKPSTVFGVLAPWSSAIPAPITGTESPTKSA
jgi:hypothetical protein